MFFFLSKTIYFLVMPLPQIIILFVASLFIKRKKIQKYVRAIAISLLVFFSNPFIANKAIGHWEGHPKPIETLQHHKLAVVLTGVTNRYKNPADRVYFERGADRVLHTLLLYKMGKIDKILISGGSGRLLDNETDNKEADELAKVLLLGDVDPKDIIIENKSRNTYESAISCSKIISENKYEEVLLITSAFHLKRSALAFEKAGINCELFGADYIAHDLMNGLTGYIIPDPKAIQKWSIIIKEITGIAMYWVVGYI